jgi:hypothetical protein
MPVIVIIVLLGLSCFVSPCGVALRIELHIRKLWHGVDHAAVLAACRHVTTLRLRSHRVRRGRPLHTF